MRKSIVVIGTAVLLWTKADAQTYFDDLIVDEIKQ